VIFLEALADVTKFIAAKDVVPNDKPLKLFRDFSDYIRLIIFSFIIYDPEADGNTKDIIEIKPSTKGIIDHEIHIRFCKKECSIVLKFIEDTTFRMTFYIANPSDNNFSRGLSFDIRCDLHSYNRIFKEINIHEVVQRHKELDASQFVKSHELVNDEIIRKCAKKVPSFAFFIVLINMTHIGYQST
jgi:hypothetical protein